MAAQVNADLSISLKDAESNRASIKLRFETQDAGGYTTLLGGMSNFVAGLDACLGAQIVLAEAKIPLSPTLKAAPQAGSEINVGALIDFYPALGSPGYGAFFPSWLPVLFSGNQIAYLNQTVLDAFDNYVTAGGNGPFLTDPMYRALNGIKTGYKVVRKYRRTLSRSR